MLTRLHNRLGGRSVWLIGFLACSGAMAFALYLEHVVGLEPCPMCVFQRVAMIFTGLVFLLGMLISPKGGWSWLVAGLAAAGASAGAFVAGRHVWLQNLPEDQVPACGAGLEAMMSMFPLQDVVRLVLTGDGNCAKIDTSLFGLSLPAWTFIGFAALLLWAIVAVVVNRRGDAL